MAIIPDFLRRLIQPFARAFTRPTFQCFTILMAGAVLTTGRRTVSNLLRTVRGLAPGHPSKKPLHEWQSLSHVRWDCKYHVVIIPK
ncbi:MAG: hypothetical protein JO329_13490 [Planctomycetaceae bacterium]|nr:hypothetical protein [Planctomycetaceae bacterium]